MGASTADKSSEDIDVSLMDDYRPCAHVHHCTYVLHIMGIVSYVEYSLELQSRIICELKKGEPMFHPGHEMRPGRVVHGKPPRPPAGAWVSLTPGSRSIKSIFPKH